MKIFGFSKTMLLFLTASLVCVASLSHAEWIGKGKEVDYLGRELSVPPKVGLLENTHPVSHDFTGKALYFNFEAYSPDNPSFNVIRFNTDKSMTWWTINAPEKAYTHSYVVFEIAKNIYFLNWAEDKAYGLSYDGVWSAAIVVDLNKMVITDAYVSPTEQGKPYYGLVQARIAFEDIAKAKGDKNYVPAELKQRGNPARVRQRWDETARN